MLFEMTDILMEMLNRKEKVETKDKHLWYSVQERSLDLGFKFIYSQKVKPSGKVCRVYNSKIETEKCRHLCY